MAMNGEVINGMMILLIMPPVLMTSDPPAAAPAPINPPIKTCVSEIGKEYIHENITSKIRAPSNVAMITSPEAKPSSIIPVPIVLATAEPNTVIPMREPIADSTMAWFDLTAFVAMMPAVA